MDFPLPPDWRDALADELESPSFQALAAFVDRERAAHEVFPPAELVSSALRLTPLAGVKAVILGQDPYHDDGQAHGLAFSVPAGVKPPPSLVNIFKERQSDLGIPPTKHGCLTAWAERGVLLLNTVLTVRAEEAESHRSRGWETLPDAVLRAVSARATPCVFVLWGKPAQQKTPLVDAKRHAVLMSPHPSPLSARTGFFGSKPFSKINAALAAADVPPVDWTLP